MSNSKANAKPSEPAEQEEVANLANDKDNTSNGQKQDADSKKPNANYKKHNANGKEATAPDSKKRKKRQFPSKEEISKARLKFCPCLSIPICTCKYSKENI